MSFLPHIRRRFFGSLLALPLLLMLCPQTVAAEDLPPVIKAPAEAVGSVGSSDLWRVETDTLLTNHAKAWGVATGVTWGVAAAMPILYTVVGDPGFLVATYLLFPLPSAFTGALLGLGLSRHALERSASLHELGRNARKGAVVTGALAAGCWAAAGVIFAVSILGGVTYDERINTRDGLTIGATVGNVASGLIGFSSALSFVANHAQSTTSDSASKTTRGTRVIPSALGMTVIF
jgi:hypothetical protein